MFVFCMDLLLDFAHRPDPEWGLHQVVRMGSFLILTRIPLHQEQLIQSAHNNNF